MNHNGEYREREEREGDDEQETPTLRVQGETDRSRKPRYYEIDGHGAGTSEGLGARGPSGEDTRGAPGTKRHYPRTTG